MAKTVLRAVFPKLVTVTCLLAVAGCGSVPSFDTLGAGRYADSNPDDKIRPQDIVAHLDCELYQSMNDPNGATLSPADQAELKHYVVGVLLNLKVDDTSGATPSVSFINPYKNMGESFSFGFGGQLSQTRQRTYTQAFNITLAKLDATACAMPKRPVGLTLNNINLLGDLGLAEVAEFGLNSIPKTPNGAVQPVTLANANAYVVSDGTSKPLSFGSTLQFTLTKQGSLAPTWAFAQFKGPSSAQTGLLNAQRIDTHQIWIAFARDSDTDQHKKDIAAKEALVKQLSEANERIKNALARLQLPGILQPDRNLVAAQKAELDKTTRELQDAQENLKRSQQEQSDPKAAAAAAQGVINTMILQNLQNLGAPF